MGDRARAGAGRADRNLGRDRPRTAARGQGEAAVAQEPHGRRVSVADTGLTRADWLERVPDLVTDCCKEWGLRLGGAYPQGAAGYTTRAELADGTPAVLKLIYPHRESEHEADALELWDGDGAVRLLARDDARNAMLLERCEPGAFLSSVGLDAALDVIIGLLPR